MRVHFRKIFVLFPVLFLSAAVVFSFSENRARDERADKSDRWWPIQSIDTMKYSRDPSRAKLRDLSYIDIIDRQVADIAQTGATHVAIGTPYDEEFIPMLRRWVSAARKYRLNVWFRGNFSGWERWFDYQPITRDEHKRKTESFIRENPDLFADGDIFTPCPECENGGPGDPRHNGDVTGHRDFLKELQKVSDEVFDAIRKDVTSGYFSMNGDVARLIMDKETTTALGGVVVIDHYVATPKKLHDDIVEYAKRSGGSVVLGEFGAPILDIHGPMDEKAQADWIDKALTEVSRIPGVLGINYWTSVGGSTSLWNGDGTARTGVQTIQAYFDPKSVRGRVTNEIGRPIRGARVTNDYRTTSTDNLGKYSLAYVGEATEVNIQAPGYQSLLTYVPGDQQDLSVQLVREQESVWFTIVKAIRKVFATI
jgi:hypothetical protein